MAPCRKTIPDSLPRLGAASDSIVDVNCFDDTPSAADADATFICPTSGPTHPQLSHGALAYVFADPGASAGHRLRTSYNSEGGENRVTRTDFGASTVRLGRMGRFKGDIQVTSRNRGVTCRVVGRTSAPTGPINVRVLCVSLAGVGQDDPFMLTFLSHLGLKGPGGSGVAYLLADRPSAGSYVPAAEHRYSSAGASPAPRVKRLATGRYRLTLPGMPDGGAVQVSALGKAGRRCVVASTRLLGAPPQVVEIRCLRLDATLADTRFFLAYES